jgi:hypothetical protein
MYISLTSIEVDRGSNEEQVENYRKRWREILDEFSKTQCQCEEILDGQRCLNYGNLHIKGHQFNLRGIERVRAGHFKSGFIDEMDALCRNLSNRLPPLLRSSSLPDWRRSIKKSSKLCGVDKIQSNRTCLTCLSRTPLHLLPCNHCICDYCAKSFNRSSDTEKHTLIIQHCPLGCEWFTEKWSIRRKPPDAGIRILSLDG